MQNNMADPDPDHRAWAAMLVEDGSSAPRLLRETLLAALPGDLELPDAAVGVRIIIHTHREREAVSRNYACWTKSVFNDGRTGPSIPDVALSR